MNKRGQHRRISKKELLALNKAAYFATQDIVVRTVLYDLPLLHQGIMKRVGSRAATIKVNAN